MFLVLEVTGSNAAALGAAWRAVFTTKGGTIGRVAGNDWILADPHVSGRHARVRAMGGTFFLEDAESKNGVLVNGTMLHAGEPFPLKEGDSIFIDPFEISVRITASMPVAAHEAHASPTSVAPRVEQVLPPPQGIGDIVPEGTDAKPLDVDIFGIPPAPQPVVAPPTGRDIIAKPVINDAFEIRTSAAVMPRPIGGPEIPEDWYKQDARGAGEPPIPQPKIAPGPIQDVNSPPIAVTPPVVGSGRSPAGPSMAGSDLESLLRGAGLPDAALSPEVAAQLGQVLREVVEGLMEVLRARGEIKNEFRLQQTAFKPRENNPLKFSADAEEVLHKLLVKRNPAYLDTPSAFKDAFDDVRAHQVAMLAGMRAAFGFMLKRFSPPALRAQFDAKPGRKIPLGVGSAGRYWESFEEFYKELTADDEDCFRRLFGDQFARSYEEELKHHRLLKRRNERRT
jgi:type VI secretion system FHA domain protein